MKKIAVLLLLFLTLAVCACGKVDVKTVFAFDTVIEFKINGTIPDGADGLISGYEKLFSKTDANSELYKINTLDLSYPSDELYSLIKKSLEISEFAGGFDITLGSLTEVWDAASEKGTPPEKNDVERALITCGKDKVRLDGGKLEKESGVKLDLGACAKGYAAEKTVKWLNDNGVTSGFISFGGSIAVAGDKKNGEGYKIGIRSPDGDGIVGYTVMHSGYLSTSGDYERFFEYEGVRYHHIIDPSTGYPSKSGVRSCTVISEDGTVSDALSTALFVTGAEGLEKLYGKKYAFEAILIFDDGTVTATENSGFVITDPKYTLK